MKSTGIRSCTEAARTLLFWAALALGVGPRPALAGERITPAQLRAGLTIETAAGPYTLSFDDRYYIDRGILRGADVTRGYYGCNRPGTEGRGYRLMYLPVSDNDLCNLLFEPAHQLDGLARLPVDTLRAHWVQAVRLTLASRGTLLPLVYLQGNVLDGNVFDVSPGWPTRATLATTGTHAVVTLIFDRPLYHLVRIGETFTPDRFAGLYRAALTLTIDRDSGVVDVACDVHLRESFHHHNGFYFFGLEPSSRSYSVQVSATESLDVKNGWKPYRYLQIREDGRVALIEHGTTPDRRYDEGPYLQKSVLDHFPSRLVCTTATDTVALEMGNYADLAYRSRYMDMFGTQFPRNAVLANYTQFGEDRPRVAAFLSYTGIGMGWIPSLLYGGAYEMRYRVGPVRSSASAGARAQSAPVNADFPQSIDRRRLEESIQLIARSARPSPWARLKRALGLEKGVQDWQSLQRELEAHWEAQTWADWRTKWLAREWVDWPRYFGRADVYDVSRLVWETLVLAPLLPANAAEQLEKRAFVAWQEEVWPVVEGTTGPRSPSHPVGVERVRTCLGLPFLGAAGHRMARRDAPLARADFTRTAIVAMVTCLERCSAGQDAFQPAPEVQDATRIGAGVAAFYLLLIAGEVNVELAPAERHRLLRLTAIALATTRAELLATWPALIPFLALPEAARLLEVQRPDVVEQYRDAAPTDSDLPVSFTATFQPVVTFPQTAYGIADLDVLLGRGTSGTTREDLSLYVRWGHRVK